MRYINNSDCKHKDYSPELCKCINENYYVWPHAQWICPGLRLIDCCKYKNDNDVYECEICGYQKLTSCTFDDDFS